ncbi:MAG: chloride channel protein [Fibrobacterota bacterium]
MDDKQRLTYIYLFKWSVIAIASGLICSSVVHIFSLIIDYSTSILSVLPVPVFLWPAIGAVIAGGIIYKLQIHAAGEGIPSYIRGVRIHEGELLTSVTFFKFWAAVFTLGFYGNGGIVGPLGRVCSGIMSFIIRKIKIVFKKPDWHTASICGMAAAVGTIFHSSIGAGIFAVEIIKRAKMGYRDIFPAVLASSSAVLVCKTLGWRSFYHINVPGQFMNVGMLHALLIAIMLSGFGGALYVSFYGKMSRLFRRKEGNLLLKAVAGSASAGILVWFMNPSMMGASKGVIPALLGGEMDLIYGKLPVFMPAALVLLLMAVLKGAGNCITVASGMSAGFTGPAAIMGMLIGASVGYFFGIDPESPTFYAMVAAGFCGMLSSSMNIPLAAAIMTVEIFGLQYSFPAGFASVVGFQVTRHVTIYDYALEEGEDEDDY